MNEGAFFQDLAMLMAVAGFVSVVFAKLKWPKVLGYILAGVVMSANTWGGSFLADESSVRTIGQLGVVFLMFSMGLEFSTSQIRKIGNVAVPAAILDTVLMTWLGYMIGTRVFGWGSVPSLFLGAAICDSATTMLAKVIGEFGWSDRPFVKYALGTSVCEDIICVGMIALVTGVAKGSGMSLGAVGTSLGGLTLFFLAVIVFGLVLVPRLLASVAKTRDDEALLLTVLGCCFFVAFVAYRFEYSTALGAFLVGVIGAASDVKGRLGAFAEPLRTMFAAVFFVSIGLMVDPSACLRHLPAIALISAAVVVGKFVNCTIASIAAGERIRTAVETGLALAQIGEFAFMVAMLYLTVTGDTASPMYQIVVAVSLITTLLNPFMIRVSGPFGEWVERRTPARVREWFETYRGFVMKFRRGGGTETARRAARRCVTALAVIAALEFAVAIALSILAARDWSNLSVFFESHKRFAFCIVENIFIAAMIPPALKTLHLLGLVIGAACVGRGKAKWHEALRHIVSLTVTVAVTALLFLEAMMINVSLAPGGAWAKVAVAVVFLLAAVFGYNFFKRAGRRASRRFSEALGAEERREKIGRMLTFTVPESVIARVEIASGMAAVGESVVSLDIRAKTGASVVSVERGGRQFRNLGAEFVFAVGDVLIAMGEESELKKLTELIAG